ncbi:putative lipid II flippase FtsW [Candidatus Daviesbacteria bacterium]|nr:putative lipid II flippase FtsW [Candidatus Daviesbacteria bacterium]
MQFSRRKSPKSEPKFAKSADSWLIASALVLTIFGLVMIYDSSVVAAQRDFGDQYWYVKNQAIWSVLGALALILGAKIDYHLWRRWALPIVGLALVLLLAVLIPSLSYSAYGASRWLDLGVVKFQPSELIKIASIFYLAAIFEKRTRVGPFMLLIILVTFVTAILQKDLGTTLIFLSIAATVYFIAGAPLWHFAVMIPFALVTIFGLIKLFPHRLLRITTFFNSSSDPQGASYHINQILIALGSGGIFGLGLGQSRQKFGYLPEATTDSIFAIVAEELGFVGASLIIGVLLFLIFRGFIIVMSAPDRFGRLLGAGIISLIGFQTMINLSSMVALVPLTGVPLPFISYGGSALVVNLAAVGILANISKQKEIS